MTNQFSALEDRAAAKLEKLDALGGVLSPSVASGDTDTCPETTARHTDDGNDDDDDKPAKQSTANVLIEMAVKHCDLFHDERNDGYAVTTHKGIRRTLKLRGREFRRWLAGLYYAETERAANNEAISTALSVLEAKATFDGKMLELSNRFAMREGVIYLDVADDKWRVIKVTAKGWEVLNKPPVLFRRYSHQQALPDPVKGGKLSDLHRHLAIKSDDDKLLVEAWLVACAFPDVPRPAPTLHGPQGATKTTSGRILKSLTDPSLTESIDLGKSPADLAQNLDHHGVPCFDNLTSIPGWAADLLCRAVTGGAFSKRELYSDDSDIILTFKRAMIITGINIPTHAPDLLDRLLLIELERIASDKRMDETTFWAQFNADKPVLFGALLDAIAGTLKHLPMVKLNRMPRMADFAKIACAYAEYTGVGAERMLDIIMSHTSRQTQEVLDADPVATAIRDFIQKRGTWTGTAAELLGLITPASKPENWPKQANALTRKINVLHATLNECGISVRRDRAGTSRKMTLESSAETSSLSSLSPQANKHAGFDNDDTSRPSSQVSSQVSSQTKVSSQVSSRLKANNGGVYDDSDGNDDKSGVLSDAVAEGVI